MIQKKPFFIKGRLFESLYSLRLRIYTEARLNTYWNGWSIQPV